MSGKVTYRQQYTRCGKQRCRKCKEGAGHGPYWYAYWSENGRTISKYIGIRPPAGISGGGWEENKAQPIVEEDNKAVYDRPEISSGSPSISLSAPSSATRKSQSRNTGEATTGYPDLRIYLLGQFRVERRVGNGWQSVTNRTWHRRRARALLGCLLSSPGRRIGREQAMEALWPDLDIETAANRLNGAVHELRQILEPEIARPAASRMLRLERDVLTLADATHIWVDAEAFESLLNKANATTDPEIVEPILEEATALYGGDYLLEELYSEWAASRRESLRRGWMGLLLRLAEMRAVRGSLTSAIEPLDKLLTTDPTHETAVRRLMVLLTQLDRRGEAIRAYQRLAAILKRDYESDPLPETIELYNALRQGHVPAAWPQLVSDMPTRVGNVPHSLVRAAPSQHGVAQHETRKTEIPHVSHAIQAFPRPILQLARQNQSPLVGRDREMESMLSTLLSIEALSGARAANGHAAPAERKQKQAHFILLTGETGIGKTRLAEELSHEANLRGWAVAWTRAYEQEGTIPYRPWTDVLRVLTRNVPVELLLAAMESPSGPAMGSALSEASHFASTAQTKLARLSTLLPELATHEVLLPPVQRTALSPEQERLHLWEAMLTLLSTLSQTSPLLLVLDDLHWTDESSLELLAYLARHLQDEHVLLVGTCRDMELAPAANLRTLLNDLRREQVVITLPVQPLTQSQIGSLVAHLPHHIVCSIQSHAGGNPLFAEELARVSETSSHTSVEQGSASASQLLATDGETTSSSISFQSSRGAPLPETITAVLERRLGKLSSACQTLLGKAAVLGGSFEFQLLLRMTGEADSSEDTTLDLLEEALRSGLITEETTGTRILYHFWHPLIVSHLYERLSAARRAQLHRRAANTLVKLHTGNEAEVAAAIVHHFRRSGGELGRLAYYAEIAGDRAFLLSAFSEAQRYYRQALTAIHEGDLAAAVNEQDPMHVAFLLERLAECEMVLGDYREVIRLYEQALELRKSQALDATHFANAEEYHAWKQQEAQIQALIWRAIGHSWAALAEFGRARECYQHGQQVMREVGVTSGAAWACLHFKHGNLCWLDGNYDEARRYGQEALEMLEAVGRVVQDQEQKPADASFTPTSASIQTHIRRALVGDPQELGLVHELLGVIAASIGQYTDALRHLNTALTIFEQRDNVTRMAQTCGNIGAVYASKAENVVARKYFHRALDLAERIGDVPSKAFVTGNLGDVAARCGDLFEAEEWFMQSLLLAERISDREHMSWCLVALAAPLQDQGNMRGALESIRRALALGRAIKNTRRVGFALVALADWRLTQAVIVYKAQSSTLDALMSSICLDAPLDNAACRRFLLSAKAAVERALSLEGTDAETITEGQLVQASIYLFLGDLEAAQKQAMKTIEETCEGEMTRVQARSQRLLGRILAARERYAEANICFEQALRIFSQYEMRVDYARALLDYGTSLVQQGRQRIKVGAGGRVGPTHAALFDQDEVYLRGLAYLREARDIFTVCKAGIDQVWVGRILAHLEPESAHA